MAECLVARLIGLGRMPSSIRLPHAASRPDFKIRANR
ncbi:hypothetical protein ACVW1C_005942 [Bradyrhizobium sp. USDA 4011]